METALRQHLEPQYLEIELAPEILDEGSLEERAAFGLFSIRTPDGSLTEGFDCYLNSLRVGPLISGYHVAEWFAWNWWRLRWEARSAATNWGIAHRMASIGEGYVWPNITMFSDGVRTALISDPSSRPDAKPFRYLGTVSSVVPSTMFEAAIDVFVPRIIGRLREHAVVNSNLDRVWTDVLAERANPEVAKRRRLEALLGRDPDEVEDDAVELLLRDAVRLGARAIDEIAAAAARWSSIPTAAMFEELAESGFRSDARNFLTLGSDVRLPTGTDVPAWQLGAAAAQAVRDQERLGAQPITNRLLAEMAGTGVTTITKHRVANFDLSFALDGIEGVSRIVLRSKWPRGRRFDLSRLLGDRILSPGGPLHPATRAYTYRQKAQRSFAVELLSPFEVVDEMMDGDYSVERQQDVAEHFDVSPMTINTQLINHGKLERAGADGDIEAAGP